MLKHKDHFHGSDLEKIGSVYGIEENCQFQCECESFGNFL